MTMDMERNGMLGLVVALLFCSDVAMGNLVFNLQHRYGGRGRGGISTFTALKAHDARRHQRILAALDLPLGGDGQVTGSGLYYTKLSIGTPPKDFYVQVDTGSDTLWVNCASCKDCPKKSDLLRADLNLYDWKASSTGKQVMTCRPHMCDPFSNLEPVNLGCKEPKPCDYFITYADGITMTGLFVTDTIQFDQVTGENQTNSTNGNVIFGCSDKRSGAQKATDRVSGIVGFGEGNSSLISQLAAAGKVERVFSHCLDNINGGGIFAIGQVVEPKFNTTPLVGDSMHYNVMMEKAEVEGDVFHIPGQNLSDFGRKTVIDSGATLAYLPGDIYDLFITKITARLSNLKTHVVDPGLKCFFYDGKIEDGFPPMKLHFDKSITMEVSPHDYLFHLEDKEWCFGFQRGGFQTDDGEELILLGDIILSNKLVVYDIENQTIGWTPHNCSSSIKVRDRISGNVNSISTHDISASANSVSTHNISSAYALNPVSALLLTATLAMSFGMMN